MLYSMQPAADVLRLRARGRCTWREQWHMLSEDRNTPAVGRCGLEGVHGQGVARRTAADRTTAVGVAITATICVTVTATICITIATTICSTIAATVCITIAATVCITIATTFYITIATTFHFTISAALHIAFAAAANPTLVAARMQHVHCD